MSHFPTNRGPAFPTTSWTLIQRVQQGSDEEAARAMEEICRQYWYPLYAFARRSGFAQADAEDIAQTFFQNLTINEAIQAARAEKGRLRSFMLAMLKRLISKHLRRDGAEKRGGARNATLSWDELTAEERYAHEPATGAGADALFDRAWAEQLQDRAAKTLREEFKAGDNLPLFEAIQDFLPFRAEPASYPAIATQLGMKESTVRQQVSRMRKRYAALIEEQIAQTVQGEAERREELNYLVTVMGG